jgi:hypothetical protein
MKNIQSILARLLSAEKTIVANQDAMDGNGRDPSKSELQHRDAIKAELYAALEELGANTYEEKIALIRRVNDLTFIEAHA